MPGPTCQDVAVALLGLCDPDSPAEIADMCRHIIGGMQAEEQRRKVRADRQSFAAAIAPWFTPEQ